MIHIVCEIEGVHQATIREIAAIYEPFCDTDLSVVVQAYDGGMSASAQALTTRVPTAENSPTKTAKSAVYLLLEQLTGQSLPWGNMTGVRPLSKFQRIRETGLSEAETADYFRGVFDVSETKTSLLVQTARVQESLPMPRKHAAGLYLHIPLCVSKCSYCSFPSKVTPMGSDLCEAYLQALLRELSAIGAHAAQKGIVFDSVYIGGGTPSVFSEAQTARLLRAVREIATCEELTFEAGRADTITQEKLRIMKEYQVSRVSLNPQSMHAATLAKINRCATVDEFLYSYNSARTLGFDAINCDLILGLEDETESDFESSLRQVMALAPENITLHALCKKRTSDTSAERILEKRADVSAFQDSARVLLSDAGYRPYYLYKQKYAVSSAENVGYAKPGTECLYNVRMMGGKQSIYAIGAGSSTKLVDGEGNYRNIFTVKEVPLYIETIDTVIEKKLRAFEKTEKYR